MTVMIVIAALIVVVLGGSMWYDHRARRRHGWRVEVGPEAGRQNRGDVSHEAYLPGHERPDSQLP